MTTTHYLPNDPSSINTLSQLTTKQCDQLADLLTAGFSTLLADERIVPPCPADKLLKQLYLPIAHWILSLSDSRTRHTPYFVGINGAQGSGKSTLCKLLSFVLQEGFGKRVVTLSIDDLYLTRQQRIALSQRQHPLLITRGVPGTHDIELGNQLFAQLRQNSGCIRLPQFDKSIDDRADESSWPEVALPVEIVLFEGWCVGSLPQTPESLVTPINTLETEEDQDGRWRGFVNQQLAEQYQGLFEQLDTLLMLQIPDFSKVLEWRALQEQKLQQVHGQHPHVMDQQALHRFIMHYERLTRANLAEMPNRADLLLKLDDNHQINEIVAHA